MKNDNEQLDRTSCALLGYLAQQKLNHLDTEQIQVEEADENKRGHRNLFSDEELELTLKSVTPKYDAIFAKFKTELSEHSSRGTLWYFGVSHEPSNNAELRQKTETGQTEIINAKQRGLISGKVVCTVNNLTACEAWSLESALILRAKQRFSQYVLNKSATFGLGKLCRKILPNSP